MNQSDYAKRHGVSRKTVTMWKSRGWLVFDGNEVDAEASDENLKKYRAAGMSAAVTGKVTGNDRAMEPGETVEAAAERILVATGASLTMEEAKRVKENYLALLNQLEYDQKSGAVVAVADVAKAVGEEYAKVRTRLLAIPAEHAPRLHRLKSVVELQDALQELITAALEELTRDGDGSPA